MQNPREIAARVLMPRGPQPDYLEHRLETELAGLAGADRGLCQELVCGVVRWQVTLDWLISRRTAGRTQKPGLQTLLRLGLYQMFWLDRVPDHAAVNETVELARRSGFGAQAGFVNALLRGYARERDQTRKLIDENREKLEAIAQALLKYETLDAAEVHTLIRGDALDRPTLSDLLDADHAGTSAPPPKTARPGSRPQPELGSGPLPQPG